MRSLRGQVRKLEGVLAGSEEPVFRALPQRILSDLAKSGSESALLWNTIYPRAQPTLSLETLLRLRPLWGTRLELEDDGLLPYYWGFDQSGARLAGLDQALARIDGAGPQTEVDLILLGSTELVLVEAKAGARLGQCGRYLNGGCPEIHIATGQACRYWEMEGATFAEQLDFGPRPGPDSGPPPCNRHYQLARTLLVGSVLASQLRRRPHLWLIAPRARWKALEPDWLDFAARVNDHGLWRRLRVYEWESIAQLRS